MKSIALLLLAATLTPDRWLADFHQVIAEMSSHYANLDSAIDDRHLDLPDLRRRTEQAIAAAKSDDEARNAIDRFMNAFGDGHAYIEWTQRPQANAEATSLCGKLGYDHRADNNAIEFARLTEFTPIADADSNEFPGGTLKLPNGRILGIIRIALFSSSSHPELCPTALANLGLKDVSPCDEDCRHRVENAVDNLLTASLERRAASLRKSGATAIVVDLTGNGGGSDWVEPAARVLTPLPLRAPRLGFIKHPHWIKDLRDRLDDVNHALAVAQTPMLLDAKAKLEKGIALAEQKCDRSGLWLDQPQAPKCSLLVSDLLFATGILPYARSLDAGDATSILFHPSQYTYTEGANQLPLVVIVDQRTASAAEYFAAMLQDNKAATIVGQATFGAGCGHTNGGIPATLENSGGRLSLPDCVRFRADGSNEVTGIVPDALVPWRPGDSRYQRAAKLRDALSGMTFRLPNVLVSNAHSHDRHSRGANP